MQWWKGVNHTKLTFVALPWKKKKCDLLFNMRLLLPDCIVPNSMMAAEWWIGKDLEVVVALPNYGVTWEDPGQTEKDHSDTQWGRSSGTSWIQLRSKYGIRVWPSAATACRFLKDYTIASQSLLSKLPWKPHKQHGAQNVCLIVL
jgi:hypothetical protein